MMETPLSSNWRLFLCGISYRNATVEEREPLQISGSEIARAHSRFASLPGVLESTIVSTCNRVEFYFVGEVKFDPFQPVQSFYRQFRDIDISSLRDKFYVSPVPEAAAHLFRVAAGIDSMVLGENQIVGQLREAYSSACAVKAAGKITHRLFHQAFRTGKLVRANTGMGTGACSVSSAAVDLLRTKIGELERPTILFIGVNQMIALAAKNLAKLECGRFIFANRTPQKAVELANAYHAEGYALTELPGLSARADIIVTCTSSSQPILTTAMFERLLTQHPERQLLIIDLAIPRDAAIGVDFSSRIEIHDLESIKDFVAERQQERRAAIPQAEEIIDRKLSEFTYWYEHVMHEPVYNGLGESFESVRNQELSELLPRLPAELRPQIDECTRRLVSRLLKLKVRRSTDNA
jgi:glutamyl-tRNA reductase